MLGGDFDHGAEVVVVLASDAGVAGIDAVLGEAFGATGIFGEQEVSVVVEVSDDGRAEALFGEALDDVGNGFGGVIIVDGDADDFASGAGESGDLLYGAGNVGSVGVGHGLHHDWGITAHADSGDRGGVGFSALDLGHEALF